MKFPAKSGCHQGRWCSGSLKAQVESKLYSDIEELAKDVKILVISGERRQESAGRAKYNEMEIHRTNATAKAHRLVHQWRSVIDWPEEKVWEIIERHRVAPHPCYAAGWNRCSCMMCIFSLPAHWAGIRELFPERFAEVEEDERTLGFTLDNKKTLAGYVGDAESCVCHDDPKAIYQLTSGEFLGGRCGETRVDAAGGSVPRAEGGPC
jgi:3'-phosphoadenosine 5'-phosphosulfate sulfotransferase (PAPS reductase)/FAD synthetase